MYYICMLYIKREKDLLCIVMGIFSGQFFRVFLLAFSQVFLQGILDIFEYFEALMLFVKFGTVFYFEMETVGALLFPKN